MHWQKPANPHLLLQSTYDMKALRGGTRLPSPSHSLVFHTLAFCEQFTAQRRRNASLQLTTSTLPLCPMHCCRHPTSLAFKAHNFHAAQGRVVAQRTEKGGVVAQLFMFVLRKPISGAGYLRHHTTHIVMMTVTTECLMNDAEAFRALRTPARKNSNSKSKR